MFALGHVSIKQLALIEEVAQAANTAEKKKEQNPTKSSCKITFIVL